MRPRVDMIVCDVTESNDTMKQIMLTNSVTRLSVYAGDIDNIVGTVSLRQLILNPETSPDRLVQRVHFVPEQKTVESLLEYFRMTKSDMAIVVDEYGGIEGSVCLEDVVEELIGPLDDNDQSQFIEQTGPLEYRLSGHLMLHEWRDIFNVKTSETRYSTLGGLVTAMIGRIARPGDSVRIRNLILTVEKVSKHRIQSLILKLDITDQTSREEM
jgi:CBS domain containing-hemolysin-like protein